MSDGPLLYLPTGEPVRLHVVTEGGDCEYVGHVDEGVAGFDGPDGHVSLLYMQADDPDDTDTIDSETLVYGEGGADE